MESPKTALPYLPISSASLIHSCLPPPQNPPHPPVPCPLPTPPPRLRLAHPHAFFLHPLPPWWLFGCTWLRSMSMPQRSTTISCRARSRPLFDCLIIYIYMAQRSYSLVFWSVAGAIGFSRFKIYNDHSASKKTTRNHAFAAHHSVGMSPLNGKMLPCMVYM